jgi:hypothetical protein
MILGGTVFTPAQCRTIAEEKLAQAERDHQHRRRLTVAAEAWLFLAYRLSGEDPAILTERTSTKHA